MSSLGKRSKEAIESTLLEGMNPEQQEVIKHVDGPLLVVAVAGAGKTASLTRRVARLVAVEDIEPSRILAVTFSRKGADEMNERLRQLIGSTEARIGTFHSVALEIHREEFVDSGGAWVWQIDDKNRYRTILKETCGYKELDWKKSDITFLESYVSLCKSNMARPESEAAKAIAQKMYVSDPKPHKNPSMVVRAYFRAEEIRRERGLLTFDDMLFDVIELMRSNEDVRYRWASKWDYVLQDEAQDQNIAQLEMGEMMSRDHKNYMIVGDPAQCIFTWRGADPSKLLSFERDWGAKVILMNRNYRCGESIIETANNALNIMRPDTRLDVQMVCERKTESEVTSHIYKCLDTEASAVGDKILAMMEDGMEPRDFAILYRTNAQSRAPEEQMISRRIPYRIIKGFNFYDRKEIRALVSYLRLAEGRGDEEDMAKCINTPFRFLGKAFVDRMRDVSYKYRDEGGYDWSAVLDEVCRSAKIQSRQRSAAESWLSLVNSCRAAIRMGDNAPDGDERRRLALPCNLMNDIIRETKYLDFVQREEGEENTENSRVSNVREMVRAAERFRNTTELLDYIEKQINSSKRERGKKDPNKVTLCSLHASKGLEWPVVFLVGCAEGVLPHGRAEDPEEEKRLFYVGVTRARDHLHMSTPTNFGNKIGLEPSVFLQASGHQPKAG